MPRIQISIKLESDLLARVDQLAVDIGVTRTEVIERAIINDLPEQESFHRSLENPVMRGIHEAVTKPSVLRILAKLTQNEITDEDIERVLKRAPEQRAAARSRVAKKKTKKGTGEGEGEA